MVDVFEDPVHGVSVTITPEAGSGRYQVSGVLGSDSVITPVPGVSGGFMTPVPGVSGGVMTPVPGMSGSVMTPVPGISGSVMTPVLAGVPDCLGCVSLTPHYVTHHQNINETDSSDYQPVATQYIPARQARSLPGMVYPEILIVVDNHLHRKLGSDPNNTQKYVISFFNAVNLRFKTISKPQIELNIAGIIIAKEKASLPFISRSIVKADMLNAPVSLDSMGKYFYKER